MIDDKANEKWDRSQNFPINPKIKKQKELRPCPFCGDKPAGTKFLGNPYCVCLDKAWSIEDWNSAYCWKRIDELEKEIKELKTPKTFTELISQFKELEGPFVVDLYKKINELTQLLATERDQFGKRETELMAKLKVAKEGLKAVSIHDCFNDNCGMHQIYADEALEKLEE